MSLKSDDEYVAQLLNLASHGDAVARGQAFDALWSEMEKIDHMWSKRFGVLSGSQASQPVTYQRVDKAFDAALRWAQRKSGFVWQHPGAFLQHLNRRLMLDNLKALKSQAQRRRSQLSDILQEICEAGINVVGQSSAEPPDAIAESSESKDRAMQRVVGDKRPAFLSELRSMIEKIKQYYHPTPTDLEDSAEAAEIAQVERSRRIADMEQRLVEMEKTETWSDRRCEELLQLAKDLEGLEQTIWRYSVWLDCVDTAIEDPVDSLIYRAVYLQGLQSKDLPKLLKELQGVEMSVAAIELQLQAAVERVRACLRRKTGGDVGH
ncbi:MAG: hypothetical protein U0892_16770 [Pirellulales bacterium]